MNLSKANIFFASMNFLCRFQGTIIVFCIILFLSSCVNTKNPPPVARQGTLDLSLWDFQKDGNLPLEGEWTFYWEQLLTPADFKKTTAPPPTGYAMVIGVWNNKTIGKQKIDGRGYATYRLLVTKAAYPGLLSIKLPDISSSYRLWVNDQLIAGVGKVSANADSSLPKFIPLAAPFADHADTLQVIVQVANFFHARGGIWKTIYLGDAAKIAQKRDAERAIEWCVAGAMFILFIYHLAVFLLRRKEFAAFLFALLCLDAAIRMVLTGERVFYSFFPNFPLAIGLRIEYFTVTLGLPVYVMVAHEFFKNELAKKIRNLIVAVGLVESLLVCVLPARIYTGTLISIIQFIVMMECLYLLYVVIKAMVNKRNFAIISFLVYCLQFLAIINDILYSQLIVNSGFLLIYVFMTFLLVQAYILAYH